MKTVFKKREKIEKSIKGRVFFSVNIYIFLKYSDIFCLNNPPVKVTALLLPACCLSYCHSHGLHGRNIFLLVSCKHPQLS